MIFLTVGSALPFDRLIQLVDDAMPTLELSQPLYAQIGQGRYRPRHFEYVDFLSKTEFDKTFDLAALIISHAGIGTIGKALLAKKTILVMPRQAAYGELVDDHQQSTAQKFEGMGHILSFSNSHEFITKLELSKTFTPRSRVANIEGISAAVESVLAKI